MGSQHRDGLSRGKGQLQVTGPRAAARGAGLSRRIAAADGPNSFPLGERCPRPCPGGAIRKDRVVVFRDQRADSPCVANFVDIRKLRLRGIVKKRGQLVLHLRTVASSAEYHAALRIDASGGEGHRESSFKTAYLPGRQNNHGGSESSKAQSCLIRNEPEGGWRILVSCF